jgi:hypothetical protein
MESTALEYLESENEDRRRFGDFFVTVHFSTLKVTDALSNALDTGVRKSNPRAYWLLSNLDGAAYSGEWSNEVRLALLQHAVDAKLPEALFTKAVLDHRLIPIANNEHYREALMAAADAGSALACRALRFYYVMYGEDAARARFYLARAAELGMSAEVHALFIDIFNDALNKAKTTFDRDVKIEESAYWLKEYLEFHHGDLSERGAFILRALANLLPHSPLVPYGRWTPTERDFRWLPAAIQREVVCTLILCKRWSFNPFIGYLICSFVVTK